MCYCPTPTLHLNLALTGDCAFLFSLKITHYVWFISVLNYGDTENVLINHLLLVIPMSYPCHYTNLCTHKPHKHAPPPHTHTKKRISWDIFFQICTCQTCTHIIVCIIYCVFAILYLANLYIIILLSVSCPVAVILLHCGASVTITNSSYG